MMASRLLSKVFEHFVLDMSVQNLNSVFGLGVIGRVMSNVYIDLLWQSCHNCHFFEFAVSKKWQKKD